MIAIAGRKPIAMGSKDPRLLEVYLIGDNADCNTRFQIALRDAWSKEPNCLNRTEFDKLGDSDIVTKGEVHLCHTA